MAEKMTVHQCIECKGKLFFNWGMQIMLTPADFKINARGNKSRYADHVTSKWINVCSNCKHPYYMDDGDLVDAGEYVSNEEIQAALDGIRNMPVGGKAKNIDP